MGNKKSVKTSMGKESGIYSTWNKCKKEVHGAVTRLKTEFPTLGKTKKTTSNTNNTDASRKRGAKAIKTRKRRHRKRISTDADGNRVKTRKRRHRRRTSTDADGNVVNTNSSSTNMAYYAVRMGRKTGIYRTWEECKEQVDGVVARFKKFKTLAEAETFMATKDPRDLTKYKRFFAKPTEAEKNSGTTDARKSGKKRKNEGADGNVGKRSKQAHTMVSNTDRPVVYTDGSCAANGRQGAKAGIGVYWGDDDPRNISERLQGLPETNQRAELNAMRLPALVVMTLDLAGGKAAIRALETAVGFCQLDKVEIRTDSMYTLNAVTKWMKSWKRNGFKTSNGTDVKNRDDIMRLYELCQKIDVEWTHVRGHVGYEGNEKADMLAKRGAELPKNS